MQIQLIDASVQDGKKPSKDKISKGIPRNSKLKQIKRKQEVQKSKSKVQTDNENDQQQDDEPRFYKSKKKKSKDKDLERNVAYPEATIREYLNQKRTTQNKVCHVLFCIYMIVLIMLMGVAFFYGNYSTIGTFINGAGSPVQACDKYVSQDLTACQSNCIGGTLYLQRICTRTVPYSPTFSSSLNKQITMYSLKESFLAIVYGSFIGLIVSSVCFILLICFAKLIYLYIAITFIMLLGFAFYLLKTVKANLYLYDAQSIFYKQAQTILPLAYILMALYLIAFPFVLFSPAKIKSAVKIVEKMNKYFKKMSSVNLFSYFVIFLAWGLPMLQIFLVLNMFSSGDGVVESDAFMYVFTKVSLSHPVVLVIHFFGIYWFFGTVVSWHKHFTSNAMCLWYFEDGERLYPVRRGLKRSWYSLGTAAIDSLLLPIEWIMHVIYGICKFSDLQKERAQTQNQKQQKGMHYCQWFHSIRQCLNSMYCKVNCHSAASAPLTNYSFKQSCQISAVTFSHHNHKFFNIGATLTVLLTIFNCLIWLIICYAILNSQVYSTAAPPAISSLGLPMLCIFLASLLVGSIFSNLYTSALDCLIFCFLLQKCNNITNTKNEVKDMLQQLFNDQQLVDDQRVEMFQYEED